MLPAWAIWMEVIPVMARKTLFGYRWVVAGIAGVVLLSSVVWTHHMFTDVSNDRLIPFMTTTELISIPTGFMFLAAIGTMWQGRIRLNTPMLLVLMSMFNFLLGGVTGVFLADVPVDLQLHDTYFVVAHFHYTILGGMVFAWFAALYYWFPKYTGRMYNELWGKVFAWVIFFAFNLTFFAMFLAGINGMNRRIATYLPYLSGLNVWISIWAFVLGLGFFIPLVNFIYCWVRGPKAPANPWGGKTLEWQTSSPPPHENFEEEPVVKSDFYSYGNVEPEPEMFRVKPREVAAVSTAQEEKEEDGQ
jgi:cytochrome c oxidase subunit 1